MDILEDRFDRFERGYIREAEQEVVDPTTNADGTLDVTVEKLITVDSVLAVLVKDDTPDTSVYRTINFNAANDEVVGADSSLDEDTEDNVVTVQPYLENDAGTVDALEDEQQISSIKVVARGY